MPNKGSPVLRWLCCINGLSVSKIIPPHRTTWKHQIAWNSSHYFERPDYMKLIPPLGNTRLHEPYPTTWKYQITRNSSHHHLETPDYMKLIPPLGNTRSHETHPTTIWKHQITWNSSHRLETPHNRKIHEITEWKRAVLDNWFIYKLITQSTILRIAR